MKFYNSTLKKSFGFIVVNFVSFLFLIGGNAISTAAAQSGGELDASFSPQLIQENQSVGYSVLVQPDGKILYAGFFLAANLQPRSYVARFNADGSLDASFNSGGTFAVGSQITKMALQADGKILLAGSFSTVAGQTRVNYARLNADGTFDPTFNANLASGSGAASSVAVQPDGKILLSGGFSSIGGQARNFARVNADGSLDATFNPACSGGNAVFQPDGKIILIGFGCNSSNAGIFRLNANGTLDSTFNAGTGTNGEAIEAVALQPDGKVLIGGQFTKFNGTARNGIARLSANGSLDTTFVFGGDTTQYQTKTIVVQPDGKILTARSAGYSGAKSVFRLNADGSNDTAFNFNQTQVGDVNSLALAADGSVYEAGKMQIVVNFTPVPKPFIRLTSSGAIDAAFDPYILYPNLVYGVSHVAVQPDGKILASGEFTNVNRQTRSALVRFNIDGSLDSTFNLDASSGIFNSQYGVPFALQTDGKIVVASETAIVRLTATGALDSSFNVAGGASSTIKFVALQPDGRILVAGNFNTIGGQTRNGHFARLNTNGTVDSFNPDFGNTGVYLKSLLAQPDGKFLISGPFSQVNGTTRGATARFNADGTLDSAFTNPNFGFDVPLFGAVQPDGKIIVINSNTVLRLNVDGGFDSAFNNRGFNGANGATGAPLTTALQADGKILVGGLFASVRTASGVAFRNNLARLNADGTTDESFGSYGGATGGQVNKIVVHTDGKIIIGGTFKMVNGFGHSGLARLTQAVLQANRISDLDSDGRADLSIFRDGTWFVNRSRDGFLAVQFGIASDKLAPADYDGDGKSDIAVWREAVDNEKAYFFIINSSNNAVRVEQFGNTGDRLSVGDWDGDGKADLSVYRDSAAGAQSYFYYRPSAQTGVNFISVPWGTTGDKAVRGDFDGDGKFDAAIYRPSSGTWIISQSSNGQTRYQQFGSATDKLVPADYDGDGRTDIAVYRDGLWIILQSQTNQVRYQQFGISSDKLVAADYDGDGRADIAVWRDGLFIILQSQNSQVVYQQFGTPNDVPIASAYGQ